MFKDDIVEEVRRAREQYAAKFNYDLTLIFADLRKREKESGHPVVSFVKKKKKRRGNG